MPTRRMQEQKEYCNTSVLLGYLDTKVLNLSSKIWESPSVSNLNQPISPPGGSLLERSGGIRWSFGFQIPKADYQQSRHKPVEFNESHVGTFSSPKEGTRRFPLSARRAVYPDHKGCLAGGSNRLLIIQQPTLPTLARTWKSPGH